MAEPGAPPPEAHRAGVVAILGPPNAGKSTLLNALLGQKIAIVSGKPQTTRSRILGIHALANAQLVLLDTPGLHEGRKPLNQALNEIVEEVAEGCEVGLVLVDLLTGWTPLHDSLVEALRRAGKPFVLAGTKADRAPGAPDPWPPETGAAAAARLRLAAPRREGLAELEAALVALVPESPPLYPDDELTDRPLRWLVAEEVRQAVFEELDQELPYTIAVEVVEFDESRPDVVRIRADLLVARDSQKRIVVGRGGAQIKRIGSRARPAVEALVGRQVYLELRVKIEPRWMKNPRRIRSLGYG